MVAATEVGTVAARLRRFRSSMVHVLVTVKVLDVVLVDDVVVAVAVDGVVLTVEVVGTVTA